MPFEFEPETAEKFERVLDELQKTLGDTFSRRKSALLFDGSKESVILLHLLSRLHESPGFPDIIFIDTGLWPKEVDELRRQLEGWGGWTIRPWPLGEKPADFSPGRENPQCCHFLKRRPLAAILQEYSYLLLPSGWIEETEKEDNQEKKASGQPGGLFRRLFGQRKAVEQSGPSEESLPTDGGQVIRPLKELNDLELWSYIRAHDLPYCSLYARGYKRITCAPCLRGYNFSAGGETGSIKKVDPRVEARLKDMGYW